MQIVAPRPAQTALTSPKELPNLAAWFDALDTSTMLTGAGTTITDGGAVALWGDKSGNSGVNCLVLPGASGNSAQVPDEAALDITGDIDISVDCALVDWTPSGTTPFCAKRAGSSQEAYQFWIDSTTGYITLSWWNSGGTLVSKAATALPTVSDLGRISVRATLDVDDGAGNYVVKFYTSPVFGSGWAQLGNTVTTAGTTSIRATTAPFYVGYDGSSAYSGGRTYRAVVKSGIDGTTVLDIDFSTAGKKLANGDTFVCATGQTVTLNSSGATGARIAGERDLFQGTLANRPVYLAYNGTKYGYLNATAGNYFSTPDSAAVSVTEDIDIRVCVAMADWTPASTANIIGRFDSNNDQRSYALFLSSDGKLNFWTTTNGQVGTYVQAASTVATGISDLSQKWIRVTRDVDNGASGNDTAFYLSDDGVTWTQLGTTVTIAGATSIFDGSAPVSLGCTLLAGAGSIANIAGRIYRAQIYDGIGGTLVADFNPALYTSGTTFTASTGEVWTINGGAHIVTRTGLYFDGSNDYFKTAAFSLSQPETVYFTGEQVSWTTNDRLYSGNAGTPPIIFQRTGSPALAFYAGSIIGNTAGPAIKTFATIPAVFNGASSTLRINRAASLAGDVGASGSNGFTVGSEHDGSLPANIFVSEIPIYSAAHATATQDRMALYAGRRHSFAA